MIYVAWSQKSSQENKILTSSNTKRERKCFRHDAKSGERTRSYRIFTLTALVRLVEYVRDGKCDENALVELEQMPVSRSMPQGSVPQCDPRLGTPHLTADLVAYIVEKIVRAVAPQRIILFGSRSREQETQSSDLDLLVIQDSGRPNRQVRRQIESLLWGRRFAMDLIVATPEQVDLNVADGNPFYTRHILGEGKVLYDRGQ